MVREIKSGQKKKFDQLAGHPLQSWSWGEFREKTGVRVIRLGRFKEEELVETASVTFHKVPGLPWRMGYWPKGKIPSQEMVEAVAKYARDNGVIMVKLEPNEKRADQTMKKMGELKKKFNLVKGRSLFTKWSLWLDLDKSEEELLSGMKSKTRYNSRLAERKGVEIVEDNSEEAFEQYWQLTKETMTRQGFYAHNKSYHQKMFETLNKAEVAHLFKAVYQGRVLVSWIVFVLNGILYYPYGASTREDKNVFASNLMMWEVIKFGKKKGCKLFDLWGSPGPSPKPGDPWEGFHRFKLSYGAELVEFVGTYDLVVNSLLYWPYRAGEMMRWPLLRLIKKLKS